MTGPQASILIRLSDGGTLTQSLVGERLWSLLDDPFTMFDDVSPRLLLTAGFISLARPGSLTDDRADEYRITPLGRTALEAHLVRHF